MIKIAFDIKLDTGSSPSFGGRLLSNCRVTGIKNWCEVGEVLLAGIGFLYVTNPGVSC